MSRCSRHGTTFPIVVTHSLISITEYLCTKLLITVLIVSITSLTNNCLLSAASGQQSVSLQQEAAWPLRYHASPWLEKSYWLREDKSSSPFTEAETKPKCDENVVQEYGRSSFSSCQAEGECSFTPSQSCSREIERRRYERDEERISLDRILAHAYVNPSQKIWPNKGGGRERTIPSEFEQCHYLTDSLITDMCSDDRQHVRRELIERFRLRNCRRFSLERALTSDLHQQVINSNNCSKILRELLRLDDLVEELACEYESLLQRYDCDAKWSVKWTCRDCRLAYREWLCSNYIPYHVNGLLIKPCQSICEQVEQKCPHLHPYGKGQYAGEPVFLCIDPNIPFEPEITPNIPYGASEWCYDSCDLEPCLNEHGESPIVDCNLPAAISTTPAPLPAESEEEISIQMFEEALENIPNITAQTNMNGNDSDQQTNLFNAGTQPPSSMDSGEMPSSETTTEFDWTLRNSIVSDSGEVDFEEVQLRNSAGAGNLADIDLDGVSALDSSTPPPLPTSMLDNGNNKLDDEGTTSRYPAWSSLDEDYNYIIQAGPIEASKQSQSIQYIEMEPLYKSIENVDNVEKPISVERSAQRGGGVAGQVISQTPPLWHSSSHSSSPSSSSSSAHLVAAESITSTTEPSFQEIYDSALLPTKKPLPSGSAGGADGEASRGVVVDSLKELTLSDDDIQAVRRSGAVVKVDNWNNRPNEQIIREHEHYDKNNNNNNNKQQTGKGSKESKAGAGKENGGGEGDGVGSTSPTVEPATGSNHYRHSRSHRASSMKNSAKQTITAQKQVYQQQAENSQQERQRPFSAVHRSTSSSASRTNLQFAIASRIGTLMSRTMLFAISILSTFLPAIIMN